MLSAGTATANNDRLFEASTLEPVGQGPVFAGAPIRGPQSPRIDVTAVGVALICAFVGSILVFGWQDKWFAGAAAKASAGALADSTSLGQARLPAKA